MKSSSSSKTATAFPETFARRSPWSPGWRDATFRWTIWLFTAFLLALCVAIGFALVERSRLSIHAFGLRFLWTSTWDPVQQVFGALPFIYGTIVSSLLALIIAVPLSLGAAIFLAEIAPPWLRSLISFVVELLAAIPSVIYGLWGIFVIVPLLRPIEAWLGEHLGFLPFFQGAPYGIGMLAGGLILAIMIIPIITAVTRDVLSAVPGTVREASYALGATKWETIFGPVLRYGRTGILGAILLGLGRALG